MEAMSHAVYVHDITHVIIDNMQFMLGAHPSIDPFKVQDSTIQLMRWEFLLRFKFGSLGPSSYFFLHSAGRLDPI